MSINYGFTVEQIREFVHEYQLQPWGQKGPWLEASGISYHHFKVWRQAVFDGDLERGLVPREGGAMSPETKRTAWSKARAAEFAGHDAQVDKLNARIRELEQVNEALGKAIGLLHSMNEQEPDEAPTTNDPDDSSPPRTNSSTS